MTLSVTMYQRTINNELKKKKKTGKKLGVMNLAMGAVNLSCAPFFSPELLRAVEENDVTLMR